jgi:hypothetical protein
MPRSKHKNLPIAQHPTQCKEFCDGMINLLGNGVKQYTQNEKLTLGFMQMMGPQLYEFLRLLHQHLESYAMANPSMIQKDIIIRGN